MVVPRFGVWRPTVGTRLNLRGTCERMWLRMSGVLLGLVAMIHLAVELLYEERWFDLWGRWFQDLAGDPQELCCE